MLAAPHTLERKSMSTPPGKNVTHVERDPALEAAEKSLRYVVHDEAWTVFWALDATYHDALKMKERIAGSRECRTVAMTPYALNADLSPILHRVGAGQAGPSAAPDVRAAIDRIRQQVAQATAAARVAAPAPPVALPPLPPVVLDGRALPRQPQLVSVPPPVVIPPAPLPRDPAMPPALVTAPPAPQHVPPPVASAPGPSCDACGNAVPADLPETNGLRICDSCKVQGELEDQPLEDLV
jgi:hypothetical protein